MIEAISTKGRIRKYVKATNPTEGDTFGNWTFLKQLHNSRGLFRCACGTEAERHKHHIFRGLSRSCGCLSKLLVSQANTKHGQCRTGKRTAAWRAWSSMKSRCLNPDDTSFPDYGGRGITVCKRWLDFSNFLSDMGECPTGLQIDRRDNGGNYDPQNCRWSTRKEQGQNKRNNRILTVHNLSMCMEEWARASGTDKRKIHARCKAGWSAKDAVFGK